MPSTEMTQYTMVCKERFDRLEHYAEETHKVIVGNGNNDGIKGQMIKLEGALIAVKVEQAVIKARWKCIFGVLAAVLTAIIVTITIGFIRS